MPLSFLMDIRRCGLTLAKRRAALGKGLFLICVAALLASCSPMPAFFVEETPTLDPLVAALIASRTPNASAPPAAIDATPTPEPAAAGLVTHTVQPGDTLFGLAMRYRVSMAAIQLTNDMGDSDIIRVGQKLIIPLPLREDESPYWVVHVVQPGDTLFGISSRYGVTIDELLRANAVADPALIAVGQRLVIPVKAFAAAPTPTPSPLPTATPTLAPRPRSTATRAPAQPAATLTLTPQPRPQPQPQPQPTVPPEVSAWAGQVVELINQKRAANGLPALSIAPELMRAAQAHAEDCSARGWGSHVGSDGATTQMRVQRAGYNAAAWGENWVQAFDPVKAVEWWYNETPPNDPHRKNILSQRYAEIGVGIAPAENGFYFIADFGKR